MKKVMVKLQNITKSYDNKKNIVTDINLDVYEGEFLTILGPSGCGKTTILRAISGMDEVTSGKIYLDGEDVTYFDPTKRKLNTIFQNYALFSHMTIEDNIAFGLKMKNIPKNEIKKRVDEMLELVQLNGFEKRKPAELSGGQQQRVAIARALVNKPKVLLLDEPLSALDLKLRKQMQIELKALQKQMGITFIYVTHDQEEALTMSHRIVIIKDSFIEQIGTPKEIYEHPKTSFVADFIGESNIFTGIVDKTIDDKVFVKINENLGIEVVNYNYKISDKLNIVIRPENVKLIGKRRNKNNIEGKIKDNIYDGAVTKSLVKIDNGKIIKVTLNKDAEIFKRNDTCYIDWDINNLIVIKEEKDEKE